MTQKKPKLHQKLHQQAAALPSPMAGLALAIASLGWTLENVLPQAQGMAQLVGAIIAAMLLLPLAAKFLMHPKVLWQELSHPVLGSVLPTFAMGMMVVSSCLGHYAPLQGKLMWFTAVAIHLGFLGSFIFHRTTQFSLDHMVPSWFVPPIGIIVAAVAFPATGPRPLAEALLWFGMLAYLFMLPLMLYRLILGSAVPDAAKPTLAILAAPASLALAGYLTLIQDPSPVIVALLLSIALLMTSLIYIAFFHLLRLPFSPGFAAFTFPMVIGSTALFKTGSWLEGHHTLSGLSHSIQQLAVVELVIAAAVVSFVAVKYLTHYQLHTKVFSHR